MQVTKLPLAMCLEAVAAVVTCGLGKEGPNDVYADKLEVRTSRAMAVIVYANWLYKVAGWSRVQ